MKLHIAGLSNMHSMLLENSPEDFVRLINPGNRLEQVKVLESFPYVTQYYAPHIAAGYWDFLLDSGVFSFMEGTSDASRVSLEKYADRYADYIKEHNISNFFELDLDDVIGLKQTEKMRDRLEARAGAPSIPVWHFNRGKDYFLWMVKNYQYVAVGQLASKGSRSYRAKFKKAAPWFIKQAKENNCKLHFLGFTTDLEKYGKLGLHSVDTTTWLSGGKFGFYFKFNPAKGYLEKSRRPDLRIKDQNSLRLHFYNLRQWVKYAKYLEYVC